MHDIHGEQYAQVDNADPFAPAVWRSPVHRTPEWIIWLVQLLRLLYRVIRFLAVVCWNRERCRSRPHWSGPRQSICAGEGSEARY